MYWLQINKILDDKDILTFAGKALCLCQKYEHSCRDIIMWLITAKKISEGEMNLLSKEHISFVDKLNSYLLGQSINSLQTYLSESISEKEIKTINDAKESRNFICHELLVDHIVNSFRFENNKKLDLKKYKNHILNLIEGDYLVSLWSYDFHENVHALYPLKKDSYIENLINWILG